MNKMHFSKYSLNSLRGYSLGLELVGFHEAYLLFPSNDLLGYNDVVTITRTSCSCDFP